MARLHEYQGKAILSAHGIGVPRFFVVGSAADAAEAAAKLGGRAVVKIQAWTTGRKALGGVAVVGSAEEAAREAERMLRIRVGNFPVTQVLVEELLPIRRELFLSLSVDDAARAPVMLLSLSGGSGIEERAGEVARLAVDVNEGPEEGGLSAALARSDLSEAARAGVSRAVRQAFVAARAIEARSLEINPLVVTEDGRVMAADCRMTVDDYAVFRHPELGIEIARELDHPPTELERIAYRVEQSDHRGTFYFAKLPHAECEPGLVGFHGAGGGGSMMSMDAVTAEGFTLANFCDTSGNPSAAKVYAAARVILSQPGLVGYFGSGSGVASQEQYWSAYGLAKAFLETNVDIPVVVRLGGNSEDRAVEILTDACRELPGPVEAYKKDDTPAFCGRRFRELVEASGVASDGYTRWVPAFASEGSGALCIPFSRGRVWIDVASCDREATELVVRHGSGLFKEVNGRPALAVGLEVLDAKDSELIACEVECYRAGRLVVFVDLPIAGLDDDEEAE